MINAWLNIINEIKLNKLKKNKSFLSKISNKKIKLLKILIELNVINKIKINGSHIKVYLATSINCNIDLISTGSKKFYISKMMLRKIIKVKKTTYVYTSANGLTSTNCSVNSGMGGLLLCAINYI